MDVLYQCCAGLDVHKKSITACVLRVEGRGKKRKEKRRFGTFTRELLEMADWLGRCGVTHVAMESTGVYWKPVWNILEGQFEVLLVNAQHIKAVPGRKTDEKDCEWIAELLQHGLLRASFVPERPVRELRELTRYRASLTQEVNRIANRIQKVLEDANIKLASVASDPLGASGRAMLKAIVGGNEDAAELAQMSKGILRNKIPELRGALEGRLTDHHRFMLRLLLDQLGSAEETIAKVEEEVEKRMRPFEETVHLLDTIPGVDLVTAWTLLAEIGFNMEQFPSAAHLASWGGLCPGNYESAGKRLSGKTRKGSAALRRCLCQVASVISHQHNNYLSARYRRIAKRRGHKRAMLAVAHTVLVIAYHMIKDQNEYQDLGPDYYDRSNSDRLRRSLVHRLERLGYGVTLAPLAQTA